MKRKNLEGVPLDNTEKYIISKSLNDSWGYPYKPKSIEFKFDRDKYHKVSLKLDNSGFAIEYDDIRVILNSLDMLYYENGDFESLYDGVTKDDVKVLYAKLEKFNKDHKID